MRDVEPSDVFLTCVVGRLVISLTAFSAGLAETPIVNIKNVRVKMMNLMKKLFFINKIVL